MGRREEKRDLTRQQMLDASACLFAQNGYEGTSIEAVAERANVSKGTFYYHFSSKEDLVIELRRSFLAGTVDTALETLQHGQAPLVVLERLLMDRAVVTQEQPVLSQVFYTQKIQQFMFRDEDIVVKPAEVGQPQRRFRKAIYELVCESQKLGQIRSDLAPQELTGMIMAFFIHAQTSWLAGERTTSLVDKVQRWFQVLMTGLSTRV